MKKFHSTILVVDDNEDDQLFISLALRKAGITDPIHLLSGGNEAIAYMNGEGKYADRLKYEYPTFITTDLKMPMGDGFDVLSFLKKRPLSTVIPTVVLTASNDPDDIKMAYLLGASSYHVKPHEPARLTAMVKALVDFWLTCEVPEVDLNGHWLPTDSRGKLGERFLKSDDSPLWGLRPGK